MPTKTEPRYIWMRIAPGHYEAGYHDDSGTWIPESRHDTASAAVRRVRELRGKKP